MKAISVRTASNGRCEEHAVHRTQYHRRPAVIDRIERNQPSGLRIYRGKDELPKCWRLGRAVVSPRRHHVGQAGARGRYGGEVLFVVQ